MSEALKNISNGVTSGAAVQRAIAAQGSLAASIVQPSVSSIVADIMKNTSVLTGADSALKNALAAQGRLAAGGVNNAVSRLMSQVAREAIISEGVQRGIQSVIRAADLPYNASTLAALQAVSAGDVSSATDARLLDGWRSGIRAEKYFKSVADPADLDQSVSSISADEYFSRDEGIVKSLADLHNKIDRLVGKNPGLNLVWRGHQDAGWGIHSNLFRVLQDKRADGVVRFPSEDEMIEAEQRVLRTAREEWRLNDMSAVEVFARLQHFGAPTRLLDVSRNPLIAAWFAVEAGSHEEKDGRLIALATGPVPKDLSVPPPGLSISSEDLAPGGSPVWHSYDTANARRSSGWGTGGNRLVWIPSAYEQRISAQNAGFVLDGIPIVSTEVLEYLNVGRDAKLASGDLLRAGSIYVHTQRTTRKATHSGPAFAPTFTFRIPRAVKAELRDKLETRYSLSRGTIYPDVAGLARYVAEDFRLID
ncbi:FRG domain-containing protein [Curtobacterium flaccumfaciens]|uniref:FRG domain-containing protein n=1 Tax=Curtobacterium flaccumfaciens TaxID=2035 RepID=UPI00217E9C54|nr:FRG domain-containing protein [Curtobacterium flaccumfaciens]MCS6588214.1 FRG domain-containing protein [Curtobacterium flaccumfaciens pv. flaccumfaciens]